MPDPGVQVGHRLVDLLREAVQLSAQLVSFPVRQHGHQASSRSWPGAVEAITSGMRNDRPDKLSGYLLEAALSLRSCGARETT